MSLPTNPDLAWPPEDWQAVYDQFAEHDAWYSGDPQKLANVYAALVYSPTPRGRFWATEIQAERRVMLHVPLAGDIAATSADLLFSESPKVFIPEAHEEKAPDDAKRTQARLEEIVEETGLANRLLEAAESAAALGGVYLKPVWDRAVSNYPMLGVAQADAAIPEFRWGVLTAVTFWRVVNLPQATTDNVVFRHLERHEPGVILHGLYRGSRTQLGRRVALTESQETADLQDVIRLPFEGIAARYVPNMRPNRKFRRLSIGQSDFSGSEGLMDALDEVYTSWVRDIRLGKGRILAPEEFLERRADGSFRFDVDNEVFTPLDMPPGDGKAIDSVQFEIRTEEHQNTALALIERIVSSAGYSPQSFGLSIEGRAESGTALRVRERKSLTTRGKKERYFRPAVADVLEMMLAIDRAEFSSGITLYRPRIDIEDSVTPDISETAKAVEALSRAAAASKAVLVRMQHPDWTDAEVKAEVDEIMREQGLSVPDPMQTGIA